MRVLSLVLSLSIRCLQAASFPSNFSLSTNSDTLFLDASSDRIFLPGTVSGRGAVASVSPHNLSVLINNKSNDAILFDAGSQLIYGAAQYTPTTSCEIYCLNATNETLTTVQRPFLAFAGFPLVMHWTAPNEIMVITHQYGNQNNEDFHFTFVNTNDWRYTLTTTTTAALFRIQWGGAWNSAYDPDLGIMMAATGNLTLRAISVTPLSVVRVVDTPYAMRYLGNALFIVNGKTRYFLFLTDNPQPGFLLINYTSLADLQDTSRPFYRFIQHSSRYEIYSNCVYLNSLQRVACSYAYDHYLDIFAFPSMYFMATYSALSSPMVVADQSLIWEVSTSMNRSVTVDFLDLSHELCGEDELPVMTPTPEGGSIPNCNACPPGRFIAETLPIPSITNLVVRTCQDCPVGTYSSNFSSGDCSACPDEMFNPAQGASICR